MDHRYKIGEIVELKNSILGQQAMGNNRVGADFRIRCLGCDHQVMLPRPKFEKSVKKIIKSIDESV